VNFRNARCKQRTVRNNRAYSAALFTRLSYHTRFAF